MPTVPGTQGPSMSSITWPVAAARVAGSISLARSGDAIGAAYDALEETLEDWDSRHDWKFTQIIAPDIDIVSDGSTDTFPLPTDFKKPYVAYLSANRIPLYYIERANWHRVAPGFVSRSIPKYYTLYNTDTTGVADLWPLPGVGDVLTVLYYRTINYRGDDTSVLDIPRRWQGYILNGAKARLTLGKESRKSDAYFTMYETGIKRAREDDRRVPDQFLQFESISNVATTSDYNWDRTY